jgi:hypothetical protein
MKYKILKNETQFIPSFLRKLHFNIICPSNQHFSHKPFSTTFFVLRPVHITRARARARETRYARE